MILFSARFDATLKKTPNAEIDERIQAVEAKLKQPHCELLPCDTGSCA
jgi:hypothetical protein